MIQIENLTHIYPGNRKSPPRKAIDNLNMSVRLGEFCILSGPNGSGKSSLLRILCGLTRPSSGRVIIASHDISQNPAAARERMSMVFQNPAVDKHLTVIENIRLHSRLYRISRKDFSSRLEDALSWSNISDRLNDKVGTLSGGLARQVELAKCLLTKPEILLLDEPTTGLDPVSRRNFITTLHHLQNERKITVLMTSHVFSEAEEVDRVAIMKDGKLLAMDSPQILRTAPGREMLVVEAHDPDRLEKLIQNELHLKTRRYGDEIRLEETENGDSLPILERMLKNYREEIRSISIRQPTLEDVFIHLTGNSCND